MPNHVLTTRVVPTYKQLEQEVEALREEAAFYKQELENLMENLQRLQEANNERQQAK